MSGTIKITSAIETAGDIGISSAIEPPEIIKMTVFLQNIILLQDRTTLKNNIIATESIIARQGFHICTDII